MKLFTNTGFSSPYAVSVFVALREKGIDFELALIDLEKGEHREPDFAARSGTVRIPMLEHDGFCLTESSAITEYLEEAFPPPRYPALYPAGVEERARARQVQAWMRSDFAALRNERSTEVVFRGEPVGPLSEAAQRDAGKLATFADRQVREGDDGLFGAWSIADLDLGLMLNRLLQAGDPLPSKLEAYARAVWERPSMREVRDFWR